MGMCAEEKHEQYDTAFIRVQSACTACWRCIFAACTISHSWVACGLTVRSLTPLHSANNLQPVRSRYLCATTRCSPCRPLFERGKAHRAKPSDSSRDSFLALHPLQAWVRTQEADALYPIRTCVSRPSQGKDSHSLRTHSVHYHPSHLTPRHFGGTPLHHLTRSGCRGSRRIGEAITTFNLPLASAPRLGLLAEEGASS